MLLGIRLRKIRESYEYTQAEIAYKCDMSPSAYGQIERKANQSSFNTLLKIANAIGISITFLVDINNPNHIEEKNKL
jgi:transcriptional regulator with XRE-family HTH domain